MRREGNFINMRMYMEGDKDGWVNYGSKNMGILLLI
jgi:hypothetical protein